MPSTLFNSTEIELISVELPAVLAKAAQGLDVDVKEIEQRALPLIKENTTYVQMLEHLIITALSLTSINAPDWKYFAGRLRILSLYKTCGRKELYDYPATLAQNVKNGVYTDLILQYYTPQDIETAASFINPDFDLATFSKSIGHSSIRTTMEIYAHLDMTQNRYIPRAMEDLKEF